MSLEINSTHPFYTILIPNTKHNEKKKYFDYFAKDFDCLFLYFVGLLFSYGQFFLAITQHFNVVKCNYIDVMTSGDFCNHLRRE